MSINEYAFRVAPGQGIGQACENYQFASLGDYRKEVDDYPEGTALLAPTYRLEEVEEIIEPEKPGVPVEPYVGLSWEFMKDKRVIIEVSNDRYITACQVGGVWSRHFADNLLNELEWVNYPHTPSTPAVTRKVKKWVRISQAEPESSESTPKRGAE